LLTIQDVIGAFLDTTPAAPRPEETRR
jgi:hypothetical protein